MPRAIRFHASDNVAIVLEAVAAGRSVAVDDRTFVAAESVPRFHKMAIAPVAEGDPVVRYGHPIGAASRPISPGAWVHTHNLRSTLSATSLQVSSRRAGCARASGGMRPARTGHELLFDGYRRSDGCVAVRNELWILPLVGCVNRVAERIADTFRPQAPSEIDGVWAFRHPYGCSQTGGDHENTRALLARLASHPNAAGVLLVGLGCESNTMERFVPLVDVAEPGRVRHMVSQETGDEIQRGVRLLGELAERARTAVRRPCPISDMTIGVKCGGSDALSGVTANSVVSRVADRVTADGGRVVMTETPEMFGAEPVVLPRCADRETFDRAAHMLQRFRDYFTAHGCPIDENPSPGNREGGITTLAEKSLGCVIKSGAGPIVDVLDYGERVRRAGVSLLDGPGNDLVAVTALAAAGAQLVLFTTGRGTPLGGPVPTLKVASNSPLAAKKPHWTDYNAGRILDQDGPSLDTAAEQLFSLVLDVASGRSATRCEENDDRQIAIWKTGVTL